VHNLTCEYFTTPARRVYFIAWGRTLTST
jgi:flagellar biosynthesis regulator FlbT